MTSSRLDRYLERRSQRGAVVDGGLGGGRKRRRAVERHAASEEYSGGRGRDHDFDEYGHDRRESSYGRRGGGGVRRLTGGRRADDRIDDDGGSSWGGLVSAAALSWREDERTTTPLASERNGGGGGSSCSSRSSGSPAPARSTNGDDTFGTNSTTIPTRNHNDDKDNDNDGGDSRSSATNFLSALLGSLGEDSSAFGDDYDHGQFGRRSHSGGSGCKDVEGAASRRGLGGGGRRNEESAAAAGRSSRRDNNRRRGNNANRGKGRGAGRGQLEERLSRLDNGHKNSKNGGPGEIHPRRLGFDDDVSSITFDHTLDQQTLHYYQDVYGKDFPQQYPSERKPSPKVAILSSAPSRRSNDSWILAVSLFIILGTSAFKSSGIIVDWYRAGHPPRGDGVVGGGGSILAQAGGGPVVVAVAKQAQRKTVATVPTTVSTPKVPETRESIIDSFTTTKGKRVEPQLTATEKKNEAMLSGVDGRTPSISSSTSSSSLVERKEKNDVLTEAVIGEANLLTASDIEAEAGEEDGGDGTESTEKGGTKETTRVKRFMKSVSAATSSFEFRDENGPRYRALDWLANHDPRRLTEYDPLILQRYVLAVLYFSMTDDGGKGKKDQHKSVRGAASTLNGGLKNWLTGMHECAWKGEEGGVLKCTKQGHVTDLSLFGGVSGTIPPEIGSLETLEVLELSNNKLHGKIPSTLGDLRKLEYLGLDKNNLSGTVPGDAFGKMPHLREVRLERNNLHGSIKKTDSLCDKGGTHPGGKIERLSADCKGFLSGAKVSCECCSHCYR